MATPDEINEFDIMRQRIKERAAQRGKTAQTGVNQNFASRGLLQSGAQIKAQERAAQDVATQAREEDRDVLVAEAQVNRAQREAEAGRQFQTSERLGSQLFAGEQAGLGRAFQTSERLSGQTFSGQQARLGEQFQSSERLAGQVFTGQQNRLAETFTSGENILNRKQNADQFQSTLDEQIRTRQTNSAQFAEEMKLNRQNSRINAMSALKNSGFSDGQIEGILGVLGLGTGSGVGGDFFSGTGPGVSGIGTVGNVGAVQPAAGNFSNFGMPGGGFFQIPGLGTPGA